MIKRSTLAMAIAIAAPLALATAEQAAAAPALSSSTALKSDPTAIVPSTSTGAIPTGTRFCRTPSTPIGTGEGKFVAALRFAPPFTKVLAASHNGR
jgi:hypothetical protein